MRLDSVVWHHIVYIFIIHDYLNYISIYTVDEPWKVLKDGCNSDVCGLQPASCNGKRRPGGGTTLLRMWCVKRHAVSGTGRQVVVGKTIMLPNVLPSGLFIMQKVMQKKSFSKTSIHKLETFTSYSQANASGQSRRNRRKPS